MPSLGVRSSWLKQLLILCLLSQQAHTPPAKLGRWRCQRPKWAWAQHFVLKLGFFQVISCGCYIEAVQNFVRYMTIFDPEWGKKSHLAILLYWASTKGPAKSKPSYNKVLQSSLRSLAPPPAKACGSHQNTCWLCGNWWVGAARPPKYSTLWLLWTPINFITTLKFSNAFAKMA